MNTFEELALVLAQPLHHDILNIKEESATNGQIWLGKDVYEVYYLRQLCGKGHNATWPNFGCGTLSRQASFLTGLSGCKQEFHLYSMVRTGAVFLGILQVFLDMIYLTGRSVVSSVITMLSSILVIAGDVAA